MNVFDTNKQKSVKICLIFLNKNPGSKLLLKALRNQGQIKTKTKLMKTKLSFGFNN